MSAFVDSVNSDAVGKASRHFEEAPVDMLILDALRVMSEISWKGVMMAPIGSKERLAMLQYWLSPLELQYKLSKLASEEDENAERGKEMTSLMSGNMPSTVMRDATN